MNKSSFLTEAAVVPDPSETSPILIVPYMWIGDFVRGHTLVRVLKDRWPNRPIDILTTTLCAPLVDYMPGVREGIVFDLPRGSLALTKQWELAKQFRASNYGTSFVLPRTWKGAIAPALAGIPQRTGFVGEVRFGLLNDWRWGEKSLPRMVDKMCMLALPAGSSRPTTEWPAPQLEVPRSDVKVWRLTNDLDEGPAIVLAPGAVGPAKRWTYFADAAKLFAERGFDVWVVGGPGEKAAATAIVEAGGPRVRDLTGTDLRDGIMALASASVVVSNDSGLVHVAAALGTKTIGIFGPTSPYHWGPLNGLAATIKRPVDLPCQPCHKPVCRINDHHCMRDISVDEVAKITQGILAAESAVS